jgi:hypothetical protein
MAQRPGHLPAHGFASVARRRCHRRQRGPQRHLRAEHPAAGAGQLGRRRVRRPERDCHLRGARAARRRLLGPCRPGRPHHPGVPHLEHGLAQRRVLHHRPAAHAGKQVRVLRAHPFRLPHCRRLVQRRAVRARQLGLPGGPVGGRPRAARAADGGRAARAALVRRPARLQLGHHFVRPRLLPGRRVEQVGRPAHQERAVRVARPGCGKHSSCAARSCSSAAHILR